MILQYQGPFYRRLVTWTSSYRRWRLPHWQEHKPRQASAAQNSMSLQLCGKY